MILDKDNKILQSTYENTPLTCEILENEGFKPTDYYSNYQFYRYRKSGLGLVQLKVFDLCNVSDKVNYSIFPDNGIVAVVVVINPASTGSIQEYSSRYLLTVRDLKNYIKFRKLMTKINVLKHQAASMLNDNTLSDDIDYQRRIKGEKV